MLFRSLFFVVVFFVSAVLPKHNFVFENGDFLMELQELVEQQYAE